MYLCRIVTIIKQPSFSPSRPCCGRPEFARYFNSKRSLPRSPTVRSRENSQDKPTGAHSQTGRNINRSSVLELVTHPSFYASAKSNGVVGKIRFNSFASLASRIVDEAYSGPPTVHAARRISKGTSKGLFFFSSYFQIAAMIVLVK
jgi:hypothetical protein